MQVSGSQPIKKRPFTIYFCYKKFFILFFMYPPVMKKKKDTKLTTGISMLNNISKANIPSLYVHNI